MSATLAQPELRSDVTSARRHEEAEALDRLRNLARWKTMTPEQMETTLTNIRRNKYALEQMEVSNGR